MILIVASKTDLASMNIANKLLEKYDFKKISERYQENPVYLKEDEKEEIKLIFINEETINAQYLDRQFNPKLLIFLSKHKSKSGIPTLSVHTPGNLGDAMLGGLPRKVSISPASAMKEALKEMVRSKDEMDLEYEVSYECTHHGPSLDVPTMFVELGSSVKQWRDVKAAEAVANAAISAALLRDKYPTALGIGGPHYNRKFTRIALTTETAFGHIIPKYAVCLLDSEILRQCIERCVEPTEEIILNWKGIKGFDKKMLMSLLSEVDLPIRKV